MTKPSAIEYQFISMKKLLLDSDIDQVNALMPQLTARPRSLTRQDLEQVIRFSHLIFARDKEQGGKVIGMACLVCYFSPNGKHGHIEDVVVDENYRGRNISIELMNHLIAQARHLNLKDLGLTCNPQRVVANLLYQRLGFQRRETNVYRMELQS